MPSAWSSDVCSSDRKSTHLNSSHTIISYAVFCLQKKLLVQDLRAALADPAHRVLPARVVSWLIVSWTRSSFPGTGLAEMMSFFFNYTATSEFSSFSLRVTPPI